MKMNKIRISTNEMTLTVRMSDEQADVWFGTLCRSLLGDYPDIAEPDIRPETEDTINELDGDESDEEVDPELLDPAAEETEPVSSQPGGVKTGNREPQGYKGFLLIKCPVCGAVRAFSPKTPVTDFACLACGVHSPLRDLHKADFRCECGQTWRYKTNMTDRMIEQTCIACGAPMTSEQDKYGDYGPI